MFKNENITAHVMQVFATLLTKVEVITALVRVRTEVVRASDKALFSMHFSKPCKVVEFVQTQVQAADAIRNFLRDAWVPALKTAIVTSLERVGKGWFNIYESNHQTYLFSKLRKLLTMVRV